MVSERRYEHSKGYYMFATNGPVRSPVKGSAPHAGGPAGSDAGGAQIRSALEPGVAGGNDGLIDVGSAGGGLADDDEGALLGHAQHVDRGRGGAAVEILLDHLLPDALPVPS